MTARQRLDVIGGFTLCADGASVVLRNRKAQALVALLALSAPQSLSRDRLASALWSERDAEQARQSLRQTLHDLRRALGDAGDVLLDIGRNDVALRPGALPVDALGLVEAIEAAPAPPEGVDWAALADAILPGLDDVDPAFGDWLSARRRQFVDRVVRALEARVSAARDAGEARAWALTLATFDPAHEPAARRLMESDAARGDLRGALRRYNELWRLLDEEYGAEPSPETQALAVRLKSLEPPPAAVAAVDRPALTLCVGEFRLDGVAPERGYLVRGFRQDLIASLTPYRDWVVIEPGPLAETPQADGVYAIEGVAFPSGEGVRINVTLKDTGSRRFVWGQQEISLALDGWFETCRLTTRRIAAALDVRVSGDRIARRAADPAAASHYDRLLLARDLLVRWEPEPLREAEALLRQVLRADPGAARAKMGLAQIANSRHLVHPGLPRVGADDSEAMTLAQAAAEADPLDAEAQLTLGWSCAMCRRPEEAAPALRAACDLNPTHPKTIVSAADALVLCGAVEEGLAMAEASFALDLGASRLHWAYRASAFVHAGLFERARAALERSADTMPHSCVQRAATFAALGDLDGARACWARVETGIAARWAGPTAPAPQDVAAWALDAQPICDRQARARYAELLRKAGAAL